MLKYRMSSFCCTGYYGNPYDCKGISIWLNRKCEYFSLLLHNRVEKLLTTVAYTHVNALAY